MNLLSGNIVGMSSDRQFDHLRQLFADMLGIDPEDVPIQQVYLCRNYDFAQAVTARNAVFAISQTKDGQPLIMVQPWHQSFDLVDLTRTLANEGFLGGMVKDDKESS